MIKIQLKKDPYLQKSFSESLKMFKIYRIAMRAKANGRDVKIRNVAFFYRDSLNRSEVVLFVVLG